jgi:hypothetical protein
MYVAIMSRGTPSYQQKAMVSEPMSLSIRDKIGNARHKKKEATRKGLKLPNLDCVCEEAKEAEECRGCEI